MSSVLKSHRVSKPASKRPKRKDNSEGFERLQKVLDSLNADREAKIGASTSTSAELEQNDVGPAQETRPQVATSSSRRGSTLIANRETPASTYSQETSGLTSLGAQKLSRGLEGSNNDDRVNICGFTRLTEQQKMEAIAACKAATSILIEIANGDSNNAYVTPYSGGGGYTYGLIPSSTHTYSSPYTNPTSNARVTPSLGPSTNHIEKSSTDQGCQPSAIPNSSTDMSVKKRKSQGFPVDICNSADGERPTKRKKCNSSGQYLKARKDLDEGIRADGGKYRPKRTAEASKQTSDDGADELKRSPDENEKAYPTTLVDIDSFLTQAKGRFPGPDSDDSDKDDDHADKKSAEKQSHNGESTISPPPSPRFTIGETKRIPTGYLSQEDHDILAIVDRIFCDLMTPQNFPCVLPQENPHMSFKGSPEAQRLATELRRQVTVLNPQKNLIVSKDLGLAMSMFYNHLSNRAFSCAKRTIPSPQVHLPTDVVNTLYQYRVPLVNHQPLPAHVYQHVLPPPKFQQAVLPSQPASFLPRGNIIMPSPLAGKEELKIQTYGFPPSLDSHPRPKKTLDRRRSIVSHRYITAITDRKHSNERNRTHENGTRL